MLKPCIIGFCFWTAVTAAWAAPDSAPLPLPDRVVLKEGAPLPPGALERVLRGLVLEETDQQVRIDLSDKRGILQVVAVPRGDVERVERGDASLREMGLNPERFQKPAFSQVQEFYPGRIRELEAFLEKYPEGRDRAVVAALVQELQEEARRVGAGEIRVGATWHRMGDLFPADRAAWAVLAALAEADDKALLTRAADFVSRVESTRNSRFFADVLEYWQKRCARFSADAAQAAPSASALLQMDVDRLRRILAEADQAAAGLQDGGADWDQAVSVLARAGAQWPELEEIRHRLEAEAAKCRQACEEAVQGRKWAEAEACMKRYRFVIESGGKVGEEAKKWMADRQAEWEAGSRLEALHADWDARRLDGLRKRIEDFLQGDGGRVPDAQRKDLQRIVGEIKTLEQEQERGRLAALLAEGKLDELAAELESRRLKLAQVPGESPERQPVSDLAVDGASAALKNGRFVQAFAFVMEAWRIHPGNARAQIALSVALLGLLVGGLAVLLPALLFYAVVSNRLNLHFFKRRLKAYRTEEERFQARQREAVERSGGGAA